MEEVEEEKEKEEDQQKKGVEVVELSDDNSPLPPIASSDKLLHWEK